MIRIYNDCDNDNEHMLTINRVITLSTVSSGYSELYCWSGAENRV